MKSSASANAVVIGGGVIGLFTAWRLLDAGFAVTVIERGRIAQAGSGASWAGGGILSPLPPWQAPAAVWQMAVESLAEYPTLVRTLLAETGIDTEWTPSGMWVFDSSDAEAAATWAAASGLEVRRDAYRSRDSAPRPGLHLPWVAQLRSPRLLQALGAYLRQRGVVLLEETTVSGFAHRGGRIATACLGDGSQRGAERFVLCAGAWSRPVAESLGCTLPVTPVRGQMLLLQAEPGQLDSILLARDHYLIPRRDGRIVVGSTLEAVGFDASVTTEARQALMAAAVSLLPAARLMPVLAQWAGLRPAVSDGLPLVGRVEGYENLFINAGHYRNGITLAPASAQRLLALIAA